MRIARLELHKFRSFESLTLHPARHALLVGEPRAGRSTIVDAIRRVLDPGSTRLRPSLWDVQHPIVDVDEGEDYPLTWVEISLLDLGNDIEQELDEKLEVLDPSTGVPSFDIGTAVLGARVRYCLQYRPVDDSIEHWVEYVRTGVRLPKTHRELLRAIVIDRAVPLQLRVEGSFRALAASRDAEQLVETLADFGAEIRSATSNLASSESVRSALDAMSKQGASFALDVDAKRFIEGVGFAAEDGSISGLLRAIQPTLDLDAAGPLPLSAHGSTAPAALAITEALAAASAEHRIIVIDDFGDALDSASTDYFARLLSAPRNQVWLSTRRAEALGAFEPEHIVRLTRRDGKPSVHQLSPNPDKQDRVRRRYLPQILAGAMSTRCLVLVEGPHDLEGYGAADRKMFVESNVAPLSARGAQLVAASTTGADGGKHRIPVLARLGAALGYEIRVVVDSDKPGEDNDLIDELVALSDQVVVLPPRTAIERALTQGLTPVVLRPVLEQLNDDHGLGLNVASVGDDGLLKVVVKQLKQKGGLHRLFVDQLPIEEHPPIVQAVLAALKERPSTVVRVEIAAQ